MIHLDRRDEWWKRREPPQKPKKHVIILYDEPDDCPECHSEDLAEYFREEDMSEGLTIHLTCLTPGCGLHFDRATRERVAGCPCEPEHQKALTPSTVEVSSKKLHLSKRKGSLMLFDIYRNLFVGRNQIALVALLALAALNILLAFTESTAVGLALVFIWVFGMPIAFWFIDNSVNPEGLRKRLHKGKRPPSADEVEPTARRSPPKK